MGRIYRIKLSKTWVSQLVFLVIFMALVAILQLGLKPKQYPVAERASAYSTLTQACPQAQTSSMDCQQKYYADVYKRGGIKLAFANLRQEYAVDSSVKSNCHQLTHAIGRAAASKYGGDVAAAYKQGDEFCWSGYYHGVMEGILKNLGNATVASKLNSICSGLKTKSPYSFNHYNCAHGLGHGIMLIEGDELFESLKTCDNLRDDWERESCYGGVYMENIMAFSNPDHHTEYLRADDPLYPCTAVDAKYRNQCYSMQTSHALTVMGRDFAKVFTLCGQIDAANQATCYQSLGRDASGNSVSDPDQTYQTCSMAPSQVAKQNCVIGAVKDFVSYHHSDVQATTLCSKFELDLATLCNQTKKDYYTYF